MNIKNKIILWKQVHLTVIKGKNIDIVAGCFLLCLFPFLATSLFHSFCVWEEEPYWKRKPESGLHFSPKKKSCWFSQSLKALILLSQNRTFPIHWSRGWGHRVTSFLPLVPSVVIFGPDRRQCSATLKWKLFNYEFYSGRQWVSCDIQISPGSNLVPDIWYIINNYLPKERTQECMNAYVPGREA